MAQYDINLREYWRILKKRKIIVIFTAIVLGTFSTAFAVFKAPTPLYSSTCSIKFEKDTTVQGLYAKTLSWSEGDDIETQLSIITSFANMRKVAGRLGLISEKTSLADSPLDSRTIAVVESLQAKAVVEREEFTNILNIRVTDVNPDFAQKLANTIAKTYEQSHSEQQAKSKNEAIRYIKEQLNQVRQNLETSEEQFNRFSQENQLLSIDLQSENLLGRKQTIQTKIREIEETKRELDGVRTGLNQFVLNPVGSETNFSSSKANSKYQATNDAFVRLLLKRDTLLEDFTPEHPDVIAISRKILENARRMLLTLDQNLKDLERQKRELNRELLNVDQKTRTLMEKKLEYDRLKRKVASFRDMTALLENKNQEASIRKAEKPEEISIVKPAHLPSRPINPPQVGTTGAMGVTIGLVLGMLIAFIVETFDTSLGAIEDVEETIGAQVLGLIPQFDIKDVQESLHEDDFPEGIDEAFISKSMHLISHYAPKSMMAESFRGLRTNIQFKNEDKNLKVISVASAAAQEGKSLVSVNLALTMAQAGLKTLLVGSDLRKPRLARVFGVESTPGITDVLMGNYPWRDTVKTITDIIMGKMSLDEIMITPGMDNLHVITSGTIPPNPAELIESQRLTDFIAEAKKEYDFIIFDAPPILSTTDSTILGTKVDGVLLVYRVGTVSRGLLKRSTTQLTQVNCNIMGVVLNGMRPEVSPDFQDVKYYKYRYTAKEKRAGSGDLKKGFSIFKRSKPDADEAGDDFDYPKAPLAAKESRPRDLGLRIFLISVALAFLTGGMLWHNGVIDPLIHPKQEGKRKGPEVKNVLPKKPAGEKRSQIKIQAKKVPALQPPVPKPEKPEVKSEDLESQSVTDSKKVSSSPVSEKHDDQ
ncbi:GumC family protein, partial [Thermodesulfobacteriota bacterium]